MFEKLKYLLEHIDYQTDTRLACRWRIHEGVVIDPAVSYGRPVVQNTGVHTRVLAHQFIANGEDAGIVADLYGVSETDVKRAVAFEEHLAPRNAA